MARYRIFISHSSADGPWVEKIAEQSRLLGIEAYLAEHDPQPGTALSEKVCTAIAASEAVVVLLTTSSVDSPYVQQEIGFALGKEKLIVPLVHPAIKGRSLAMLDGVEYITFDFNDPHEGSSTLLQRLQTLAEAAERNLKAQRREQLQNAVALAALIAIVCVAAQQA